MFLILLLCMLSKFQLFIVMILSLLLTSGYAVASDADEIENMCKNGGNVRLEAKQYNIDRTFSLPSNIELIGQYGTVLRFVDNCGIPQNDPMIYFIGKENVTIRGIQFEGNQKNQKYVPYQKGTTKRYGQQYNTFIYAVNSKNIKVTKCAFNDNLGDGLRCSGCSNVEFSYNTGRLGGHDTCFLLRCNGVKVHHNSINPLVNSAIRLLDVSHARVYNNYIEWTGPRDAGPAIQIQHDKGSMVDIEVCNNVIMASCGPGLWLVGKTRGGEDLSLHHNLFYGCGDNRLAWVGGIIASGYGGAVIENNVFDSCWMGGTCFYAVNAGWGTKATATITKNIFTNAKPNQLTGVGGYGIYNNIGSQKVKSSDNCFYSNSAGNFYGSVDSSGDISGNPKTIDTPSDWYYDNGWQCPDVNPKEMDWYTGDSSLSDSELEDAEQSAKEFEYTNIVLDIMNIEYVTQAEKSDNVILPEGTPASPQKVIGSIDYYKVGENYTTVVNVPTKGFSEVQYNIEGELVTHILMIGEKTKDGLVFTETSIWDGDFQHTGNSLKLTGKVPQDEIKIKCISPLGDEYTPTMETSTTVFKPVKLHPASIVLIIVPLLFGLFIRLSLRRII